MRKQKVLVVTHDAGGSEIIAAYVHAHRTKKKFNVYTNGPGMRVFRRLHVPVHLIQDNRNAIRKVVEKNKHSDLALLPLPGWMTTIERIALEEAKRAGLKTAVYLEDWRKYRERFGYPAKHWKENLPDELWAGDKPAYALARTLFKNLVTIKFVPNEYFKSVRKRFKQYKKKNSDRILFLSSAWGMEEVFESLLHELSKIKAKPIVRIRFHPSENRNRYDAVINKFGKTVTIEKSSHADIAKDFALSSAVIGTQTAALALSAFCGLRTIDIHTNSERPRPTPAPKWTRGLRSAPPYPGVHGVKNTRRALLIILKALH